MKMSTPTSLWCYSSYLLKLNAGKVYCSSLRLKQTKPRKRFSSFLSNTCSTSLLSSGMQRQLIVTGRNKPSGKTFRQVDFAARFMSTLPSNCPKFPRILSCLMLFKTKINNNKSTNKFQNSTVFAFFKTLLTVNI